MEKTLVHVEQANLGTLMHFLLHFHDLEVIHLKMGFDPKNISDSLRFVCGVLRIRDIQNLAFMENSNSQT